MMNNYRRTKTTVSLIHYHFVFCPRYRRKIFLNTKVKECFKELVQEICVELDIAIVAMACDKDHVHLFLHIPPTLSSADTIAKMKGVTSKRLREAFSHLRHLPSLWDAFLFFSIAENVSSETIKHYVEN
ncbi:IS200/IS605 family transposase [Bacillus thuringiensis]|uniref:IS200/IS605 family transposase n=1 Tax=Bacillus thuringiensis TaxID=1428 RepID=UPI000BECBF74|nr:IS200/IS605 family transposase [Bacillus thuringiensis]EKS8372818.1 IS200/IS605 family transposase [Bacillus cereus]MBG9492392.1 transposase [Bacillus thuringiensis]MBG9504189.1 transposase [Bacillus thuringiensis]MBG9508386.1 transposase [Bacillus thuringiensis]MBG9516105.1 transposase [Bacillus thuringiensis]